MCVHVFCNCVFYTIVRIASAHVRARMCIPYVRARAFAAGELRDAVQPHEGRGHLPEGVWRSDAAVRGGRPGPPRLLRR